MSTVRRPLIAALGITAWLAGCASPPPPPPPPVPMTCSIKASAQLNPTVNARPSPLLLRIYALKSAAAFESADFDALYRRDAGELASDLTGKDEFTLTPGDVRSCSKMLTPETRFLGVIGAYRDLEHATWRVVAPIEGGKKADVQIRAGERSLELAVTR